MPEFIYHCPHCGQKYECDSEQFDGSAVALCPNCQQEIRPAAGKENKPEIVKLSPRETKPDPVENAGQKKPLTLEEILKKEHRDQNNYTYPWLCYVFNIAAVLNGIGAVASLVFLLAAVDQKKDFILPLSIGVVCVVAFIINIGISQLIIFVGETSYNTKILRIIAEHKMSVNDTEDPS